LPIFTAVYNHNIQHVKAGGTDDWGRDTYAEGMGGMLQLRSVEGVFAHCSNPLGIHGITLYETRLTQGLLGVLWKNQGRLHTGLRERRLE